jgi:hypothetical protein
LAASSFVHGPNWTSSCRLRGDDPQRVAYTTATTPINRRKNLQPDDCELETEQTTPNGLADRRLFPTAPLSRGAVHVLEVLLTGAGAR